MYQSGFHVPRAALMPVESFFFVSCKLPAARSTGVSCFLQGSVVAIKVMAVAELIKSHLFIYGAWILGIWDLRVGPMTDSGLLCCAGRLARNYAGPKWISTVITTITTNVNYDTVISIM